MLEKTVSTATVTLAHYGHFNCEHISLLILASRLSSDWWTSFRRFTKCLIVSFCSACSPSVSSSMITGSYVGKDASKEPLVLKWCTRLIQPVGIRCDPVWKLGRLKSLLLIWTAESWSFSRVFRRKSQRGHTYEFCSLQEHNDGVTEPTDLCWMEHGGSRRSKYNKSKCTSE